ncbi:MAG: AI-2E family transporter [Chloroflexota bacterium]
MIRTDSGYARNINILLISIFFVVLLIGLWQIRGILMLALAGVLLTVVFSMPVKSFMRWRIGRILSIMLSMTIGVLVLVLLSFLVFPTLFEQFATLFETTIPTGINQFNELLESGELYQQVPFLEQAVEMLNTTEFEIDANFINQVIGQTYSALNSFDGSVIPLIGGVASALVSVFIIVFICFFLITEPRKYVNGIVRLTPLWYRERMREIIARIDYTMHEWIKVTGISMLLVGTITGAGLAWLGVDQWLALGVIAGIVSFIPNFSVFIILVPTIAVTLVQTPETVWIAILIVIVASFVQANIVGPILASEALHLPPVLILIGQIVFGFFFGFLGIMLAVPLSAITVILIEEIYIKDVLGDDSADKEKVVDIYDDDDLVYAEAD